MDAGQADNSGTLNLAFSYTGRRGDLVIDTVSVDQTGNYALPVLAQLLDETLSQDSPFWTVSPGFDTMYMLWNWTDKAEDVMVTFYASSRSSLRKSGPLRGSQLRAQREAPWSAVAPAAAFLHFRP